MRWVLLVLLASACGEESPKDPSTTKETAPRAQPSEAPQTGRPPAPTYHRIELPGTYKAWKDEGDGEDLRVVLTLDATGRLFFEGPWTVNGTRIEGGPDEPRSLHDLGAYVHQVSRLYGKTHPVNAEGIQASSLDVLLRADRNAAWWHVQLIMTICSEQKVYKLWLAGTRLGKDGEASDGLALKVKAHLPTDRGMAPTETEEEKHFTVPTQIVLREGKVAYKYGDSETADPKELYSWIQGDYEYALGEKIKTSQLSGEIKAARGVPAGAVVGLLSMYLRAGFPSADFRIMWIPTIEVRRQIPLPKPG